MKFLKAAGGFALVGTLCYSASLPAFSQVIPSGGQNQFRHEWFTQRLENTEVAPGSMFYSGDGSHYVIRGITYGSLSFEVYRSSDNKLVNAFTQFGTTTVGRRFFGLSATGEYFAVATTGTGNERVNVYDVKSGARIAAIGATWPGGTSGASCLAFSPNTTGKQFLAIGALGTSPSVRLYEVSPTGAWNFSSFVQLGGGPTVTPNWISWNNDGTRIAVCYATSTLANMFRVYDVSSPATPLPGFVPSASLGTTVAQVRASFNNAGTELAVAANTGFARFAVPGGTQTSILTGLANIFILAGYNAADSALVGRPSTSVTDYNFTANMTYTSPSAPQWVASRLDSDEFRVAESSVASGISGVFEVPFRTYNFGDSAPVSTFARTGITNFSQLSNALITSDGSAMIVGLRDTDGRRVLRINTSTGQVEAVTPFAASGDYIQIAFSLDQSQVYAARTSATGVIDIFNTADMTSAGSLTSTPSLGSLRGVAVVPTGPFAGNVYAIASNSAITIWNSAGTQLANGTPSAGTIALDTANLQVTPDGQYLYYAQGEFVRKLTVGLSLAAGDLASGLNLGAGASCGAIAISPDGRRVALSRRATAGSVFPLVYDNTQVNSFASLVSSPIGSSSTTISALGITWLANDYYAFIITTLGSSTFTQNTQLIASETGARVASLGSVLNPAQMTYDKMRQRLYFGGYWNGDATATLMPEAAVYFAQPTAGTTTAVQLYGTEVIESRSWGNLTGWGAALFGDFNGDSRNDIVWHNSTLNQTAVWTMVGTRVVDSRTYNTGTWVPVATGDVNGDGNDDIIWQSGSQTSVWLMDGARVIGSRTFQNTGVWQALLTADLNGDGIDDIVWQNDVTNQIAVWIMNSSGGYSSTAVFAKPADLDLAFTGDVNGDGFDDLIFRNGIDNGSAVWLMLGANVLTSTVFAAPNTILQGVGDLDNDGKVDIVSIWNEGSGFVIAYQDIASGIVFDPTTVSYGSGIGDWRIVNVVDLNQDMKADFVWRNSSTNQMAVWTINGQAPLQSAFLPSIAATDVVHAQRF
ncbi:MAG: FG-GAP-like repeat-containing protein [Fimbriimonadaceae bacterium]